MPMGPPGEKFKAYLWWSRWKPCCICAPYKYTFDICLPCARHHVGCVLKPCGLLPQCGGGRTDYSFPPCICTLGNLKLPETPWYLCCCNSCAVMKKVEWQRASAVVAKKGDGKAELFKNGITTKDIQQGGLGDCWLIAAIACLAEFPEAIESLFLDSEDVDSRSKRHIRLFHPAQRLWLTIEVDDWVPAIKKGGAAFLAKPHDAELWVMALEKAFAKLVGSYNGLAGGHALWALHVMTACPVYHWRLDGHSWVQSTLYYPPLANRKDAHMKETGSKISSDSMFGKMHEWDANKFVLTASAQWKGGEHMRADGIVQGHSYSVLRVYCSGDIKLLRLRNPWGKFEWKGDWSDNSGQWGAHPDVKQACKFQKGDDGAFWISWSDFLKIFNSMGVCYRQAVAMKPKQQLMGSTNFAAPAYRCVRDTIKWWCLCHSVKNTTYPFYFMKAGRHNNDIYPWDERKIAWDKPSSDQVSECWQCYLDRYPDLQKAFGPKNVNAARDHFANNGMKEGRDNQCSGKCS